MGFQPAKPPDAAEIDAEFRQKVNIEYLILQQIAAINRAASEGDEMKFNNSVDVLLAMLPKENIARIAKREDEYTDTFEDYEYQYSCGHRMGTPESPVYYNNPEDWDYDGGERVLISPILTDKTSINYQELYKIILAELQDIGVTWRVEPRERIGRRVDPPPTPLLKENAKLWKLYPTRIATHYGEKILVPEITPGYVPQEPTKPIELPKNTEKITETAATPEKEEDLENIPVVDEEEEEASEEEETLLSTDESEVDENDMSDLDEEDKDSDTDTK